MDPIGSVLVVSGAADVFIAWLSVAATDDSIPAPVVDAFCENIEKFKSINIKKH
jgi:hypothetical protein